MRGVRRYVLGVALLVFAIGALWLAHQTHARWDWTAAGRYSLSPATRELLSRFQDPITLDAYVSPGKHKLRATIGEMLERYRRAHPDFHWRFVNPYDQPEKSRQLGISQEGQLVLTYQGRSSHLTDWSEPALGRVLHRLLRQREQWIVFLSGHGERDPLGAANYDLGLFGEQLQAQGARVQPLNPGQVARVPDNTSVLVIAGPQARLTAPELAALTEYLERGGNLLWLLDSAALHGLDPLAEILGIRVKPGVLVDPGSKRFFRANTEQDTLILAREYSDHPLLENFGETPTLFAEAVGLSLSTDTGWRVHPLAYSAREAWSETDDEVKFQADRDLPGPFVLAAALARARAPESEQRIVVIGDGDFLSNTYLGNGGNLDLGLRVINWLGEDDQLIQIPLPSAPDARLQLPWLPASMISLGFLFLIPGLLLAMGAWIAWRRRRLHGHA